MTPDAQVKAISEATGLCPKCDFLSDPEAIRQVELKLQVFTPLTETPAKRLEMILRAIGKWE